MSGSLHLSSYTASQAREKFYTLIRSASRGLRAYEIRLRGNEPVILVNKGELESWLETLDILSNPQEIASIRKAGKQKQSLSHQEMLKAIKLKA